MCLKKTRRSRPDKRCGGGKVQRESYGGKTASAGEMICGMAEASWLLEEHKTKQAEEMVRRGEVWMREVWELVTGSSAEGIQVFAIAQPRSSCDTCPQSLFLSRIPHTCLTHFPNCIGCQGQGGPGQGSAAEGGQADRGVEAAG